MTAGLGPPGGDSVLCEGGVAVLTDSQIGSPVRPTPLLCWLRGLGEYMELTPSGLMTPAWLWITL